MKVVFAAAVLAFFTPAGLAAASTPAPRAQPSDVEQIQQIENAFIERLKEGQTTEAYDATLGKSPLMAGRDADKQVLVGQFASGISIYGPVRRVEQVSETRLGSTFVRRFYIAQHDKMLTRWEIDFALLPGGWVVVYLGFDDKVQNWE